MDGAKWSIAGPDIFGAPKVVRNVAVAVRTQWGTVILGHGGDASESPRICVLVIRCTFNGLKVSSATFPVTFVEDVER